MADLDSAFRATQQKIEQGQKALDDLLNRQKADDRSHIAKLIVWAFVILMCVVVLGVILGVLYFNSWDKISEPAKFLMAILSSVMLPVVTLVIGHYFGNK